MRGVSENESWGSSGKGSVASGAVLGPGDGGQEVCIRRGGGLGSEV